MSGNPYQKRWSTPSRSATRSAFLTSGVEPSTIGTSWNSVRWTKPSTSTRENLASRFETKPSYSLSPARSRYGTSNSETRNAAVVASLGPSVLARASRFDSASTATRDKYRTEARELINKWTSRERGDDSHQKSSSKYLDMFAKKDPPAYRNASSLTPTRSTVTPVTTSRYDSGRSSLSATPVSHILKAERPWRQRLAESSRIRATLGDDYLTRQKPTESSAYTPSTRFTTSATPSYSRIESEKSYMSKSYSPIRTSSGLFQTRSGLSSTRSTSPPETTKKQVSQAPTNPALKESSLESSVEPRRKLSSKERTARRASRQGSLQQQESSSDEEISRVMRSRSSSKQRRLRKKSSRTDIDKLEQMVKVPVVLPTSPILADPIAATAAAADDVDPGPICATPLSPSLSRSSSKNGVTKSQIIKCPSLVEVNGLRKSDSKSKADRDSSLVCDRSFSEEVSDMSRIDDESQYSAVAYFNPKKKSRPPVPGTWNDGTEQISKNKMFVKRGQKAIAQIVLKDGLKEQVDLLCQAPPLPVVSAGPVKKKKLVLRKKKPVEESVEAVLQKKTEDVDVQRILKIRDKLRTAQKLLAILPVKLITLEKHLLKPNTPPNGIRRTLKIGRSHASCALKCKSARIETIQKQEAYRRKSATERATVIVDTPTEGVNFARVRLTAEVVKLPVVVERDERSMSRQSTRASEVLDEMRYTEPAVEWTRPLSDEERDELILPDESILEQYMKRKRVRRHHTDSNRPASACLPNEFDSSVCPSPCNSTVSELLPSANYYERRPLILTPPSVGSSTTTTTVKEEEPAAVNNFNAKPKGFTRTQQLRVMKPIQFDEPKSPFEERLQQQANRIRRGSTTLSAVSDVENRQSPTNRSTNVEGMSAISQQFTDAALAQQSHVGRYAAHIPVSSRGEGSGRNSVISLDSVHSGVLETASKKLDSVIDQARQRHHHHRSKFKEAIDYLDQIFEDLKKEYDVTNDDDKNNNDHGGFARPAPKERKPVAPKRIVVPPPTQAEKKTTIVKPTVVRKTSNSNSLPNRAAAHREKKKEPSPVEVMIRMKKQFSDEDENIAETIALPKKTDKQDFTRRWLEDDLKSLAHIPPQSFIPSASIYQDCDEHSLGSCSAEVAAINTKERKKSTHAPEPTVYTQPPMARTSSQGKYNTLRSEGDVHPSPSAFQNVNSATFATRQAPQRASLRSLPGATRTQQDAVLAIDQLVAELDLNTEQQMTATEKRRSFPTAIGRNDVKHHHRQEYEPVRHRAEMQHGPTKVRAAQGFFSQPKKYPEAMRESHQKSLDEATEALLATMNHGLHQSVQKQSSIGSQSSQHGQHAFETINQEKINPSRVEAMQNMFERGTAPTSWKRQNVYTKQPKEEETYYEINEFSAKPYKRVSPPREVHLSSSRPARPFPPSRQEPTHHQTPPTMPVSQPPQRPPGSAGSSTGGYYSSNSIASYPVQRQARGSSTATIDRIQPSGGVDDEDDGFYDNIGIFDDRRFSCASEMDTSSISSRQLPPQSAPRRHNRIGSFLRKIGGSAGRPPGSAASLLSLNRVSNETVVKPSAGLMKSNSLSTEPWRKQCIESGSSMPSNASLNKGSLGARLKNTLFGSKKRLN